MLGWRTSVHLLQEFPEGGGRPELRDGLQFLEGGCESVRQAPQGAGLEFIVLRVEVQGMNPAVEVVRDLQFRLDEGSVDDELRRGVGELGVAPAVNLLHHRPEVALHLVYADATPK